MDYTKRAKEIYDKLTRKYYSPTATVWEKWYHIDTMGMRYDGTIDKIKELLEQGYKVKCGYSATSVRGYHRHHIFYKK